MVQVMFCIQKLMCTASMGGPRIGEFFFMDSELSSMSVMGFSSIPMDLGSLDGSILPIGV